MVLRTGCQHTYSVPGKENNHTHTHSYCFLHKASKYFVHFPPLRCLSSPFSFRDWTSFFWQVCSPEHYSSSVTDPRTQLHDVSSVVSSSSVCVYAGVYGGDPDQGMSGFLDILKGGTERFLTNIKDTSSKVIQSVARYERELFICIDMLFYLRMFILYNFYLSLVFTVQTK